MKPSRLKGLKIGFVLLICLVALLGTSSVTQAFWHIVMNDNFEADPPPPAWPWPTGNGTSWYCIPWPPAAPGFMHTWGKEDSTVYRANTPRQYRSIWCAGLPNDRIPGNDTYPTWMNAWAVWGPIEITTVMEEVGGVFFFFGSIEEWSAGAGDRFLVTVTDNTDNLGDTAACPMAFDFQFEDTDGEWLPVEFDFADLDSAGDSVSYMPFYDEYGELHTRDDTYISLVFNSNGVSHEDFLGIFVDDYSIGYDDGLYDFEMLGCSYMQQDDTLSQYFELHVDDPVRFRNLFAAKGPVDTVEALHVLYIDTDLNDDVELWDLPFDSMTAGWEFTRHGTNHSPLFQNTWVPEDTGWVIIGVSLDADLRVDEWSENNNFFIDTVYVLQPQTAPYINWLCLREDTLEVPYDERDVEITYEAFNSPDSEWADITVYYDYDDREFNGSPTNHVGARIINGENSFTWNTSRLDPGVYYLYAQLNDYWLPVVQEYAVMPIRIHDIVNDVGEDRADIPTTFDITAVYPNPFNPTVEVTIAVPEIGDITAKWYSLEGRLVDTQSLNGVQPGYRKLTWTPDNLASGMYLLRLSSDMGQLTTKVVYLK
ncbi:MAG: T9SS type A sorting domain-containing protein [Candidatus Electryonea clarkiae]|nr:T9SS type A sorting domain-containing protein [Candidatus Electryonea clarkiae]